MKWLELKTIVRCLKLRATFRFKVFFSFFVSFSHKVVQTWFVWHEICTQHYLVYIILLKWLELKTLVICLKLRAKFLLKNFKFFWHFLTLSYSNLVYLARNMAHNTIFIYYCFKMVRIEKNSHMHDITCLVTFLRFF